MIQTVNIYWIAGILEGEGSFIIRDSPTIQLSMTDLDTVQKYKEITRANTSIRSEPKRTINNKIIYHITINGILAIQWMMTIYPLMSQRRKEQIRRIIRLWKLMQGKGHKSKTINELDIIQAIAKSRNISFNEAADEWLALRTPKGVEK